MTSESPSLVARPRLLNLDLRDYPDGSKALHQIAAPHGLESAQGQIYWPFALNRGRIDPARWRSITHLPSGYTVGTFKSRQCAVGIVKLLRQLPEVDWLFAAP